MSILNEIFENKRREVAETRAIISDRALQQIAAEVPPPPDFAAALQDPTRPRPRLIAEIKWQSPSRGILRPDLAVEEITEVYAANGAAAISVLTDKKYFGGSLETLQTVARKNTGLPLLRKDFIFHRYQLLEARAFGASAALLIVAMLDENSLGDLIGSAFELGLTPLVEVHTLPELEIALRCNAPVVGINNRNLHTFAVKLETSIAMCKEIPEGVIVVAESGIHKQADVRRLAEAGIHAILVGESLVTSADVGAKVRELAQTSPVAAE